MRPMASSAFSPQHVRSATWSAAIGPAPRSVAKCWCRRETPSSSRPTPGPTTCGEGHRLRRPTHWNALSTFCGECSGSKPATVSAGRCAVLRSPQGEGASMALYDRHGLADRLFLDGEWTKGGGGSRDVVNPSDGGTLGSTGIADTEDVDHAVQAGRAAQLAWAEAPFDDRAKVLRKAGQLLEENAPECADWLMRE